MNILHSRQSAFEAMNALMSAVHQPDSLRVSKSGEVTVTNGVVTLFNRAVSQLQRKIDKEYKPTDWHAKAREAVLNKLAQEVSMFNHGTRREDLQILEKLIANVTESTRSGRPSLWRDRFTEEIAALKNTHIDDPLISALEKIDFFGQPGNRALFPHVRKHLAGEGSLPQALEMGLNSYLTKDRGLPQAAADNASGKLAKAMINYGSSVHETIDFLGKAGRMIVDGSLSGQHLPALPLAFLCGHHGLSLDKAKQIFSEVHAAGKTVAEARETIQVMLTYDLPFNDANDIIRLAASMVSDPQIKPISVAQKTEIAWLRLQAGKSPNEATLISLSAGPLDGRMPVRRDALLAQMGASLQRKIAEATNAALPAGWPQTWEAMKDGSRRLTDTTAFKKDYLQFLQDSLKEGGVDNALGVASVFVQDAQRTHFRFGEGRNALTVKLDANQALDALTAFEPDPAIRQSLSRALFQGGGNALAAAIHTALAAAGRSAFSILSLDLNNGSQKANARFWISVQRTEEGKLRVGYTMYFKHFTLQDLDQGRNVQINGRFNSSTSATETDHTARASALVEFDPEQLREGIIEPQLVREPELRLTIEPDIDRTSLEILKAQFKRGS